MKKLNMAKRCVISESSSPGASQERIWRNSERLDDNALSRAQEVLCSVSKRTTPRARMALARKALAISPLCADAYNLLANEARTPEKARELYFRGVEAGLMALGPERFEEFDGHFWSFLEARPYMRARQGLAMTLLQVGEEDAALEHFGAMLKLNPNDNQGNRYLLLAGLLRRGDLASAKTLLIAYACDLSPNWIYASALIAFHEGTGETAATLKLLKDARCWNEHVATILAGIELPAADRNGYIGMNGRDEATGYVGELRRTWRDTTGTIARLLDKADPVSSKRPPAKKRAPKLKSAVFGQSER